ncbi:ABC-type glycerol-3-phosphate transport system substrate-binding protein [Paenibacillus eucommiae]|uniref:ABC-type glycerol-3-phosphate transport system substrate-binding protein n=2 Tax=Paenibacillus eucommiae TaxID=1355755 RepID=A0ABS4IM01_9BACL|nr:ABC-type glycerol-3-phosphate transport system substrate-binding protein [Paenibacillus eucommiae]
MKKMSFVLLVLMFAMSTILAACSSKSPAVSEPPSETAKQGETAKPDATPGAETEKKQYSGEIVISLDNTSAEGFASLQEAYKKVQPDVKLVWEPKGGPGTDYPSVLGTMLAAGTPRPDIVAGAYMPTYDKFLNFDKYRYQTNPYTGNKWDEDLDFNFWVGKNAKGERSVLTTQSVHIMWFYNKDIFNKLNLVPPTNWDEMVEVSKKISDAGIIPIASSYGYKVPLWMNEIYMDQFTRDWHDLVRAQPGDYNYDDDVDGTFVADPNDPFINLKYNFNQARFYKGIKDGTIRFDTPEVAELVTNMAKLFPKYAQKDFFVSNDDYPLFLQQKAAMIIDGTWSLPTVKKDMENLNDPKRLEELQIKDSGALKPFEWGTFENPPMVGSLVQGPVRSVESATGEYISIVDKNQEQSDMVLDFVMFWLSKPGYQAWVDGQVKANKFIPGGPIMIKGVEVPEDIKELFGNVKMLGNAEIVLNNLLLTRVADVDKANFNLYKEALEGKITPEDFGKKLQESWTKNFDEIIKQAGLTADNIEHPDRAPGK